MAPSPVPAKQDVQAPAPVTAPRTPLQAMLSPQRGTKDPSLHHTVPSERDLARWVPTSPCTPLHFLT